MGSPEEEGGESSSGDKGWPNRVILGVSNPITLQEEMSGRFIDERTVVQLVPVPRVFHKPWTQRCAVCSGKGCQVLSS